MTIREKGYSHWQGELKTAGPRWLPITLTGIKATFKKKYAKLIFAFSSSTFFIFLVAIYVSSKPELKILTQLVRELGSDAALFRIYYTNGFLVFMLIILSIFSGAELISADLKSRALPLYFSRPLGKTDYLLGKFSIVLFYLLLFTLLPGILLLIFKMIFTGRLAVSLPLLIGILCYPLVVDLFLASFTLALSIASANRRLIGILIFLIYIFGDNLAQALKNIFHSEYFYLFSIQRNIMQIGHFFFREGRAWNYPPWLSPALFLALSLLSVSLLYIRIKKVEASA